MARLHYSYQLVRHEGESAFLRNNFERLLFIDQTQQGENYDLSKNFFSYWNHRDKP